MVQGICASLPCNSAWMDGSQCLGACGGLCKATATGLGSSGDACACLLTKQRATSCFLAHGRSGSSCFGEPHNFPWGHSNHVSHKIQPWARPSPMRNSTTRYLEGVSLTHPSSTRASWVLELCLCPVACLHLNDMPSNEKILSFARTMHVGSED